MVDNIGVRVAEKKEVTGRVRLHGGKLWVARGSYFLLLAFLVIFFILGFPAYYASWSRSGVGTFAYDNSSGRVYLVVASAGDAAQVGVLTGDYLLSINGTRITSAAQANSLLTGKIGDSIVLYVQSGNRTPRTYTIFFAGTFLDLIKQYHLTLSFITIYNIVIDCLLTLGVILSSLLVFLRHSRDWLAILVAFAMASYGVLLLTTVRTGAYLYHLFFIIDFLYNLGMAIMFVVFFVFPTGHFVPKWTRWATILVGILATLNFINLLTKNNVVMDLVIWASIFALGIVAQLYRYWKVSTPAERQQTKRLVAGMISCFLVLMTLDLAAILSPRLSYGPYILFTLFLRGAGALPVLLLNISFILAVYRYRLWDTDLYINRTLVYTGVTVLLVIAWVITAQVLNYACQQLLGKQAGWLSALLSSLQVAVIYKPVRKWVEKWVNARFYKDRIDYSEVLVELKPEMWNYLTLVDLGHILVTKVPDLLKSNSGALFIQDKKTLKLVEVQNMHPSEANNFHFSTATMEKISKGQVVSLHSNEPFSLLVPLSVSRLISNDLVGVLAIGQHAKGGGYSRDHINDLASLGQKAGLALYMLQLNEKKRMVGLLEPPSVSE